MNSRAEIIEHPDQIAQLIVSMSAVTPRMTSTL